MNAGNWRRKMSSYTVEIFKIDPDRHSGFKYKAIVTRNDGVCLPYDVAYTKRGARRCAKRAVKSDKIDLPKLVETYKL